MIDSGIMARSANELSATRAILSVIELAGVVVSRRNGRAETISRATDLMITADAR